jgi:hypothetical protein
MTPLCGHAHEVAPGILNTSVHSRPTPPEEPHVHAHAASAVYYIALSFAAVHDNALFQPFNPAIYPHTPAASRIGVGFLTEYEWKLFVDQKSLDVEPDVKVSSLRVLGFSSRIQQCLERVRWPVNFIPPLMHKDSGWACNKWKDEEDAPSSAPTLLNLGLCGTLTPRRCGSSLDMSLNGAVLPTGNGLRFRTPNETALTNWALPHKEHIVSLDVHRNS